ncbi:hypothetical protein B5F24_04940 [Bacteroides clarus]|uniref:Uncharacterized protein n=1 Tax=Bacteroides clarus TaxID=626929 RepID=A0A1Y4JVL3_9BACE|nr:hypothetical protein [Bacteroides clarus]OUP35320.1 hypothetical protein B5F24_04940 [Bacteroides clarus]
MENRKLLEFVEYFDTLYYAGDILLGLSEYEGLQKHCRFIKYTDKQKEHIVQKINKNWRALFKHDPILLTDEIWKNMFDKSIDTKIYIIYVLRRFGEISSYLNLGNTACPNFQVLACNKVIERVISYTDNERTERLINGTLYNYEIEKYIFFCRRVVLTFLTAFDCKCHDFGYDIMEIQKSANFCVYKQVPEAMEEFKKHGYGYDIALPPTRSPQYRQENITDYLNLNDEEEKIGWVEKGKKCETVKELAIFIAQSYTDKILRKIPSKRGGGLWNLAKDTFHIEDTCTNRKLIEKQFNLAYNPVPKHDKFK